MNKVNWGNIAVDIGIVLDICATVGYAISGEWKKSLYWLFATGMMIILRIM
jgi:hypothetical protein